MKNKHKILVGVVIVLLVLSGGYGIYTQFVPQGAAVANQNQPAELSCPTGEDLEMFSNCKTWKEGGAKPADFELVSDAVADQICASILVEYEGC